MSKTVTAVLSGTGGYGHYYLKTLLEKLPPSQVELKGAVDPFADVASLEARGIRCFSSMESFYENKGPVDLAVIVSPIQRHVPQSLTAMQNGSHVLCDKPLAATVQEARDLISARDSAGRWVMIGYQWSFSKAIQSLKSDILKGRYGKPLRLKTLCLWPRDVAYFERNDWAGKIKDRSGRWVLDSPANNAMAHFLHNLLYLAGEKPGTSLLPGRVAAEVYRAYPIENYDTIACRVETPQGAELLFYASHATKQNLNPIFEIEFDEGIVSYDKQIVAHDKQGRTKNYGSPEDDDQFKKLFDAVENAHSPKPILCGPEAALAQTLCINGIQDSIDEIPSFPESLVQWNKDGTLCRIEGLDALLFECYQKGCLPADLGVPWARSGRTIDLKDYNHFPGG